MQTQSKWSPGPGVRVLGITLQDEENWIVSAAAKPIGICPDCGMRSRHRHGWHNRCLRDLPVQSRNSSSGICFRKAEIIYGRVASSKARCGPAIKPTLKRSCLLCCSVNRGGIVCIHRGVQAGQEIPGERLVYDLCHSVSPNLSPCCSQRSSASAFVLLSTSFNRISVALSGSSNSGLWAEFSNT